MHTFHSRDVFPQFAFTAFAVQGHPQNHNLKEEYIKITPAHPSSTEIMSLLLGKVEWLKKGFGCTWTSEISEQGSTKKR